MRRLGALVLAAALAGSLASCSNAREPRRHDRGARAGGVSAPAPSSGTATGSSPTAPTGSTTATGPTGATASDGRTRFAGRITPLPPRVADEMDGTTWQEGCPVPLEDLSLLRFNYVDLDGQIERGPMVVNASVASDVLWVFKQLFEARFPLQHVALAREFHEKQLDHPNSRKGTTASFNCRVIVTPSGAGDVYSQHSFGLAVDVNPLQNPFVREDGWVRNRYARPYVDRSADLPGVIHPGDVVTSSFAAIGWLWGGNWSGDKDYMHFSANGQ